MVKTKVLDIAAVIARVPLFSQLSAEVQAQIAAETRERSLRRTDILFQKGDTLSGFFVIVSGQIKLAFASAQGNEKVVEVLGAGQSFGEAAMFMGRPCPVFAQAVATSTVLQIPKSKVVSMLECNSDFAQAMLAGLAMRLHSLISDVESYSLHSSAQRVIGYLLQHATSEADGPIDVCLPTSKQVIASRLNLTPETLSRIFHDLAARGMIEVRGKIVRINDLVRLQQFEM